MALLDHRRAVMAVALAAQLVSGCASSSRDGDALPRALQIGALAPGTSTPGPSMPGSSARPAPPESRDVDVAEPDPFPVLHAERIGPFEVGMSKEAVVRLAPGLRQSGPVIEEGATGDWVEFWSDPAEGLTIGFAAATEDGPRQLRSVEITAPSRLVTRRNVGIGATYEGVRAEYQDVLDRDFPPVPTAIIVGSLYGGMMFQFEGGVVKSIFIGAMAE